MILTPIQMYFQVIDQEIAAAVQESISRHMWYLSEDLVVVALCDPHTALHDKRAIVQALMATDRPQQFAPQIPAHRPHLLSVPDPSLADFVGPRSWLLFQCLQVEDADNFLSVDPSVWQGIPAYDRFSRILHQTTPVNDVAERAVRDVVEYVNYSRDNQRNEDVILVVNSHRELVDFAHLTKEECAKLT